MTSPAAHPAAPGWFDSGREAWTIFGRTEPPEWLIEEAKHWWRLGNASGRRDYPNGVP